MKKILVVLEEIALITLGASRVFAQGTPIVIAPPENLKIIEPGKLITALIGLILIVAALASFFFLVLGGIRWITSGGDKAGVDAARNQIQAALLGLFIVFAAWAFMIFVQNFLGFQIFGGTGFHIPTPFSQ